jgi:hypothetical protein
MDAPSRKVPVEAALRPGQCGNFVSIVRLSFFSIEHSEVRVEISKMSAFFPIQFDGVG